MLPKMKPKASWNAYRHFTSFVKWSHHCDKNFVWISRRFFQNYARKSKKKKQRKKLQNYNQNRSRALLGGHGFSFYNRKIPNIMDRIPRSAATSKKRTVDDAVKRVCFLCSLFGVKLFRKRVKKSVQLKYAKIPIIKQTSAHIKRALLRASRLKGPVSVT